MKELLVNYMIDCSDQQRQQYTLICSVCGKEWRSTPIAGSEISSSEERKKRSALEANGLMEVCPLCGDVVCSDCIVSVGNLFMCRNCAARIG